MLVKFHPLSNYHCSSGYLRHKVRFASHIRHENFGEVWRGDPDVLIGDQLPNLLKGLAYAVRICLRG